MKRKERNGQRRRKPSEWGLKRKNRSEKEAQRDKESKPFLSVW